MTIFSEGDTLTLPNFGDVTWAVTSVRLKTGDDTAVTATPLNQRERPRDVIVGLANLENANHGTALNAATLAQRMRDYRQNPIVALVDQLATDLYVNGVRPMIEAEALAGRLVIAGWKR